MLIEVFFFFLEEHSQTTLAGEHILHEFNRRHLLGAENFKEAQNLK